MKFLDSYANQKGMSIVEVVIASTTALVVIAGIMTLTSNVSKNQIKQKGAKGSFYSQGVALTAAKDVLFDVYSSQTGKRTEGICRNLFVENARPGINYVELFLDFSFFEKKEENTRWAKALPNDWEVITCGEKLNIESFRYKKCLKLINKDGQTYFAVIGLNPVSIDAKDGDMKVFSLKKKKEDIKKIAFDLNTVIFNQEKEVVNSNKSFIPAADVGYCELKKERWRSYSSGKTEYYKVYPSGSGLVDDAGKNIYNSTSFEKEQGSLLGFKLLKLGVQAGKLDDENLSVDSRYNVEISCNEKVFKCSNNTENRVFDENLGIDMVLTYDPGRVFPDKINSNVGISFSSSSGSTVSIEAGNINSQADKGAVLPLKKGSNNYSLSIKNTGSACNKICRSVDEKNSFYRGNFSFELYRGSGKKKELLEGRAEVFSSSGEVACTTCYMKSCSRLGLGTFGPIQRTSYSDGHPIEPLDGNIPECAVRDTSRVKSFARIQKIVSASASVPSPECLSGNFFGEGLNLKKEVCSKKLPVMCFSFGKFRLARNINTGEIIKESKELAGKICFEQGLEVLGKKQVKEWLSLEGENLQKYFNSSEEGEKLSFVNLANQGIFIAPQTKEQISDSIRVFNKGLTSLSEQFWLGYDLNASGDAVATLPRVYNIEGASSIKESALFFDSNSSVDIRTPENTLRNLVATVGTSKVGVLLHNIKHKGVAFIDAQQRKAMSYICFNESGGYFISLGTGKKYIDGVSICNREDAQFYPPQTPLQWSSVLLKLNNNEYNKPFPDQPREYYKGAWVAVESLVGGETSYSQGKYILHFELSNLPLEDKLENRYKSVLDLIKARKNVSNILKELNSKAL